MKPRLILVGIAAVLIAAAAQAQDLKPVKDKATKLFGYQDKSKNWVIPPTYEGAKQFKDGLAEVTNKPGKTKFHGIIDVTGKEIIPVECTSISVSKKEKLITAEKLTPEGNRAWGVYDYDGNELWKPQFVYSPSFSNGLAVVRSASNYLEGVIDTAGNILVPFENLEVDRIFGEYNVLTKDFVRKHLDSRFAATSEFTYPGYIAPYDPAGDPVRAAAWHAGPIGRRLYYNSLRSVQLSPGSRNYSVSCSELRIDWGEGRFVRLEPVIDEEQRPGSMLDPLSDKLYTLEAVLYEPNGLPVEVISRWGWIEEEYTEGAIYNAEGTETWMVMSDINAPAKPNYTVSLSGRRTINHEDVMSGMGIRSYDLQNMHDPERLAEQTRDIITGDNLGITSRLPQSDPGYMLSRTIGEIHRLPLFQHRFLLGDIVNCKVRLKEDGVELDLSDRLVCRFRDDFSSPSYHFDGEETVFWGPYNEYSVFLSARPINYDNRYTKDDCFGSNAFFEIALELYDGYDHFVQTIATAQAIDFCADGWAVMEKEGIALRFSDNSYRNGRYGGRPGGRQGGQYGNRPDDRYGQRPGDRYGSTRYVMLKGATRLPATTSALKDLTPKR